MSIAVVCPGCDARLNAPDAAAGRTVKCPKCKAPMRVPEPAEPAEEPKPVNSMATGGEEDRPRRKRPAADEEEDDRPRKKGKKPAKSGAPVGLIVGAVAAVLLLGGGGFAAYWFGFRQPATPASVPPPAPPPAQPEAPKRVLTALYRFWDKRTNEHVYTYGDGEPAEWRKNPAFEQEKVVGYAVYKPEADAVRLYRVLCRDGRHRFSLRLARSAEVVKDIARVEDFTLYVWTKPGDGRVPVHACFLPDDRDFYFERDMAAVRSYTDETLKVIGKQRLIVENMFYLYPTAESGTQAPPKP